MIYVEIIEVTLTNVEKKLVLKMILNSCYFIRNALIIGIDRE